MKRHEKSCVQNSKTFLKICVKSMVVHKKGFKHNCLLINNDKKTLRLSDPNRDLTSRSIKRRL